MRKLLVVLVAVLGVAGLVTVGAAHMGNGSPGGMQGYGPGSGWNGGMGPGSMGSGMGPGAMHSGMGQGWMGPGMGSGSMGSGMGPGWMHGSGYGNGPVGAHSATGPSTKLPPRERDRNIR